MSIRPSDCYFPEFSGIIGTAREDITPPVGIFARNWGAAQHEVAEGIHRPLTLTALTLQTAVETPPLVLIAADLGWWRMAADEWHVRGGVLDALNLDESRLMINLAHTHAGPSLCREDADNPGGHLIAPYLDRVRQAAIEATQRALATAQSATLTWAIGKCELAQNRDLPDPDSDRIICGYHAGGIVDDIVRVGRVTADSSEILATLVHYACHPTTLAWENRLISPDYPSAMREVVEAQTGQAPCLFLLGACGELAPREQYTADTALPDSHGRQLGYAALSVLAGMLPPRTKLEYAGVVESGAPLANWKRAPKTPATNLTAQKIEVAVPLQAMPTRAEIAAQLAACEDRVLRERLLRKRRVRETVGDGETAHIPVWLWQVGDSLLVGNPNEAYNLLQTELQRRFPEQIVLAMNVTNGHCGYLPPEPLYALDTYPVWQSPFGRGSLERLIAACDKALEMLAPLPPSAGEWAQPRGPGPGRESRERGWG